MAKKSEEKEAKSPYTSKWILEKAIPIIREYNGNFTIRALHYRLVGEGMTNNDKHYKKVVNTMIKARWDGDVEMDAFMDHERETIGQTDYEATDVQTAVDEAKESIRFWAGYYKKNKWENQPNYVEVFIEKKALQGVFERPCKEWKVALNPCKGYPSLTFLNDAKDRFEAAIEEGKNPIILYFGDYDCSGEDIPRSIVENLEKMGVTVDLRRVALKKEQVIKWKLPPAPTKESDSRGAKWDGLGQVELDAVMPDKIEKLLVDSLESVFDEDLYDELKEQQATEKTEYKKILKRDFKQLLD